MSGSSSNPISPLRQPTPLSSPTPGEQEGTVKINQKGYVNLEQNDNAIAGRAETAPSSSQRFSPTLRAAAKLPAIAETLETPVDDDEEDEISGIGLRESGHSSPPESMQNEYNVLSMTLYEDEITDEEKLQTPSQDQIAKWVKDSSDLQKLRAELADLWDRRFSDDITLEALESENANLKRVKKDVELGLTKVEENLKQCLTRNEEMEQANNDLKRRIHSYAREMIDLTHEQHVLEIMNIKLQQEVKTKDKGLQAAEDASVKMIADLQAEIANGLRRRRSEEESAALNVEVKVTKEEMLTMEKERRESENEMNMIITPSHQKPSEDDDDDANDSLEAQFPGIEDGEPSDAKAEEEPEEEKWVRPTDYAPRETRTEDMANAEDEKLVGRMEYATESTQTKDKPDSKVVDLPTMSKTESKSTQTESDSAWKPNGINDYAKSIYATVSTQTPVTPIKDKQVSPLLEQYRGERPPRRLAGVRHHSPRTTFVPVPLPLRPGTPGSSDSDTDSSPSSVFDGTSPNRKRIVRDVTLSPLSSISGSDRGRRNRSREGSHESPRPKFAENTPELAEAELARPVGLELSFGPIMTTMEYLSQNTQQQHDGQGEANEDNFRAVTADKSVQTMNIEDRPSLKQQVGKRPGRQICSSIILGGTLTGLILVWYFCGHNDKQLWLQANEVTRRTIAEMRDERWTGPTWLAKITFSAENWVKLDRSMLG